MTKLTIIVDIDGTVADMHTKWLARIHEVTGIQAAVEDITQWNLGACPPLDQVPQDTLVNILNEPGFTLGIPVIEGASEQLYRLHVVGHKILFVTARRGDNVVKETPDWLRNHFPWVDINTQLIFESEKHKIAADVIVDDKADTLIKYKEVHPAAHILTISYPYNQVEINDVFRVPFDNNSWSKLCAHIDSIAATVVAA